MPHGPYESIDSFGLRLRICIIADTGNNSAMPAELTAIVERQKMLSIQRQDYPVLGHSNSENVGVALPIAGFICVEIPDKLNIMAEASQTMLNSRRELLVGQETGHP